MANPEHLKILERGVSAWNAWISANRKKRDSFRFADLSGANLKESDLSGADFQGANLNESDLSGANLSGANLIAASLGDADLSNANLRDSILFGTDLSGADLSGAILHVTTLRRAELEMTRLDGAKIGATDFGNVNLSEAVGLDTIIHRSPSTVGVDSLYKSQGKIPDNFLRDAGVPEEIIDVVRSIRAGPAIQWHSCFISYSTKDDEFARRLHSRMQETNIRVWFAPEDLKGGKKLHEQLFEAIQVHDRLLLVLSEHSIQSEWVMTEIRKARDAEKKEKRRKLFPIRLTSFETLRDWTCFDADTGKDLAVEVREYFIPDFSNWKDHDAFESAFARLQQNLKAETKPKLE